MSKHYIYIHIYIYIHVNIYIYIYISIHYVVLCSLDASHMSPRHIYTQNKVSMCLSPHLCVTVIIPVHCPNGILLDVLGVLVLICMCFFRGGCITISFDRVCPLQGCSTREYIPGFSWLSPIAYYTCLYMYICTYIYIHLMIVW